MKRRGWLKFGVLAGVATLFVGGAAALAKGKGGHCGMRGGWDPEQRRKFAEARIDEVLDELDVTKDQRVQIYASRDKLFKVFADTHTEVEGGGKLEKVAELFQKEDRKSVV